MDSKNLPVDPDKWSNLIKYSEVGSKAFKRAIEGREFDFDSIDNPYTMIIETLESEENIHIIDDSIYAVETFGDYINHLSSQTAWSEDLLGVHGFKTGEGALMEKLRKMEENYEKITEMDETSLEYIQLESSYLNDFFNSVAETF